MTTRRREKHRPEEIVAKLRDAEATLAAAEERGWRVEKAAGGHAHVWGRMLCPQATREGCIVFVHSTPRNPQSHARHLQKRVDGCPHLENCERGEVP